MHVADELLRDRARSTAWLAEYSAFDRAGDADYVDAVVLIEALIFNSDERLRNVSRQRPNGDTRAQLAADITDQRAVARENLGGLRGLNQPPRLRCTRLRCTAIPHQDEPNES